MTYSYDMQLWHSNPQKVAKLHKLDGFDHTVDNETQAKMKTAVWHTFSNREGRTYLGDKAFWVPLVSALFILQSGCYTN
jgi:hypothetical protein